MPTLDHAEAPDEQSATDSQSTAYDAWLSGHKGVRGRESLKGLQKSPFVLAELPSYFAALPPCRLAACWVSCITEAITFGDFSVADVARALIVVADRLHGTRFEISGEPLMTQAPPATPLRAASLTPKPPEPPGTSHKYAVHSGPPPAPKASRARSNEAMEQAQTLAPGGWFIWEDAPKTLNCVATTKKWKAMFQFDGVIYRSTAGRVIVKRSAPESA